MSLQWTTWSALISKFRQSKEYAGKLEDEILLECKVKINRRSIAFFINEGAIQRTQVSNFVEIFIFSGRNGPFIIFANSKGYFFTENFVYVLSNHIITA